MALRVSKLDYDAVTENTRRNERAAEKLQPVTVVTGARETQARPTQLFHI